jgi:hypothetical protein
LVRALAVLVVLVEVLELEPTGIVVLGLVLGA